MLNFVRVIEEKEIIKLRLRKKRWARPEIEKDPKAILNPCEFKGKWKDVFENEHPIHLELGCGKGSFITELAKTNPKINYIAIDTYDEMIAYALRKLKANDLSNVRMLPMNIEHITEIFSKNEIERIYINFCNPWPSRRHNRRRLTHTDFLERYKTFLKKGSEVWFKTDDDLLFGDSLKYFEEAGFDELYRTSDLYRSDFQENIPTEYEEKFIQQGITIKFSIFKLKE